jgi:hypothetical protein
MIRLGIETRGVSEIGVNRLDGGRFVPQFNQPSWGLRVATTGIHDQDDGGAAVMLDDGGAAAVMLDGVFVLVFVPDICSLSMFYCQCHQHSMV